MQKNPFRYRCYYYDVETGFYYLNARYYDPQVRRFISADSVVTNTGEDVLGYNLYAYCLNNPINMIDSNGNCPFFVVTAVVGAVAGAVIGGIVATRNGGNIWAGIGVGAAAGALIGTGVGTAAGITLAGSITASTGAVVAGGSTLCTVMNVNGLGAGAIYVSNNISKVGNNAANALGNLRGIGNPVKTANLGSTGRTVPNTLNEQMAMQQVQSNPLANATKVPIEMTDSRWLASKGWVKMQSIVLHADNTKTVIHFVYNEITGAFDDFKFK